MEVSTGDAHASLVAMAPADFSRWVVTLGSIESQVGYGRVTGDATLRSSYTPVDLIYRAIGMLVAWTWQTAR